MWGTFPAEHLPNATEFLKWIYAPGFFSWCFKGQKAQQGGQHCSEADAAKNCLTLSGLQNTRYYPVFCIESNIWASLGCTIRRRGRESPQTLLSLGLFCFINTP